MSLEKFDREFYSNGKLLLTGEYVVLDGSTALAIPTKYGQSLGIEVSEREGINWKSFDENNSIWFEEIFNLNNLETSNPQNTFSKTLSEILRQAKRLNPSFLTDSKGFTISTKLDFPRDWGLGTSSTLINNIAQWANVDAFKLLRTSFGGSGYDIAAAQSDSPILYELKNGTPKFRKVHLPWEFTESLFFVHLNKKQESKEGIAKYRKAAVDEKSLQRISDITNKLLMCYSLSDFEKLMEAHEEIISEIINLPTIKKQLFSDYPNTIKSLGAWGGDFILATGGKNNHEYFKQKGFKTVVPFEGMIKKTV